MCKMVFVYRGFEQVVQFNRVRQLLEKSWRVLLPSAAFRDAHQS